MSMNDTNPDRLRTRSMRVADHVSANSERDAIDDVSEGVEDATDELTDK